MCQGIISSASNMAADTANTVLPQRLRVISPLVTIGTSAACVAILASVHIKSEIFQRALS